MGTDAVAKRSIENFIAHYGRLGMRWGRRRTQAELASDPTPVASDAAKALATQKTIRKTKSLDSVSSQELQHLVNRINLEQKYSQLAANTKQQTRTAKGAKFVKTALKNEFVKTELREYQKTGKLSPGSQRVKAVFSKGKHTAGKRIKT